jgi:hypothetical protein
MSKKTKAAKLELRSLKPVYLDRLQKLAEHLEFGELAHVEFNFSDFNTVWSSNGDRVTREGEPPIRGCGTAGCAIGECPAVFKQWEFRERWSGHYSPVLKTQHINPTIDNPVVDSVMKFFGLTRRETEHLFYPDSQREPYGYRGRLDSTATREAVARNIRSFVHKLKTDPWIHGQ